MAGLKLVVISGLSGSGKSHALKCFEDAGYFCIDNLPPALLPTFVELCHQQGGEIKNVALGIDVRERVFFSDLVGILEQVKALGHSVELMFFEACEEVLVRRFSESRRPHPLLPHLPMLEGVRFEKEHLAELRRHADRIIDTSDLTVHELRELLAKRFGQEGTPRRLTISLVTFGFKFGVPYDIDLLFDVRFLQNPFFVPDLKPLTGEDPKVRSYVLTDPDAVAFIGQLEGLFKFLVPLFERERRSYVNVGIGCTGGRHRSVAIAGRLQESFAAIGYQATIAHRDINK
ncbi:MAG: RNase adapter RapZ [Nitrospira sp.]|nr:RNase adapter RapZ [Nitrospira sp.]MBP0121754.1 RNase adapter RapZ [Nitrospira sp.]MBP0123710.1 RNase adapter RapZ [Nitrospira sp.]MBP0126551.1 RNase adapter RapZ [Nitrospira sp.]MBP0129084.1 RNase adapter RapZ [Nitrospira sp.]